MKYVFYSRVLCHGFGMIKYGPSRVLDYILIQSNKNLDINSAFILQFILTLNQKTKCLSSPKLSFTGQ